jgi:hypothetical protein
LAKIVSALEKEYDAKDVAGFLMRCALPQEPEQSDELFKSAGRGWTDVEANFLPK